ncbi:MAG: histidinol-phosphatase HisJ family protein [Planctomycetota bacterium]|jgi:histidinol-phosphatase (PHP family)
MWATYHNHTSWSDGRPSVAELIAGAHALGAVEVGISDHFCRHRDGRIPRWAMPPNGLGDYIREIRAAADGAPLPVRVGVEIDWFDGHAGMIGEALAPHGFDYVIGSVHEVDGFEIDATPRTWDALSEDQRNEVHRRYWLASRDLARSGLADIMAHLDLAKKFGHRATIDLQAEIGAALDAIAEAELVVEVNTAGWHKPVREAYPDPSIIRRCVDRGIRMTISADAHQAGHLLRDFDRAEQLLRDAGCTEIARFRGREVEMVAL